MRALLLAGLAWCTSLLALAQAPQPQPGTRSLSLRECIDLSLSRNLDLQIEHLTADVAGYNLSGAYGAYIPAFTFRAQHGYVSEPGDFDPQKANPDFPYELKTDTLSPGLTGRLPIGLSYDVSAFTTEKNAATDFRSDPADARLYPDGIRRTNNYSSEFRVDLQQHLLKDFWIDSDREQILLRRRDLKISQQGLAFQIMRTVLAVELSYYDLAAARENVRVQEQALELRKQFLSETHRRVEVGDLPPLDAEQAETQLQITQTALTAAREALVAQQNVLKSLITDNFRQWADVELQPSDSLLAVKAEFNRSESFMNALKNRPDLLEARLAVEKSDVVVRFRKNQLFPSLDLVGRYGGLGVADEAGHSINNTFSFINPEYFYGAVVSFPLSNVSERGNYRASKAAKQISELQLKKAEQDVLVQVADFINHAQSRFSQINSTRQARIYAEAALAAEQKKLQNGLSTSFFVLELQEVLTAARTAELQAVADYTKIVAQLAFAEGSILERHHISVLVK
jgi:outer membrane protein TolC